ncbi:hypothetical protein D3C87_1416970 [compost metagenome]
MSGQDKLAIGEGFAQLPNQTALPFRVQVQIDLVDQDDAVAFQRVVQRLIHHRQPARDVADQRHHRLLPLRELGGVERYAILVDCHVQAGFALYAQVTEAGHESGDGGADCG